MNIQTDIGDVSHITQASAHDMFEFLKANGQIFEIGAEIFESSRIARIFRSDFLRVALEEKFYSRRHKEPLKCGMCLSSSVLCLCMCSLYE